MPRKVSVLVLAHEAHQLFQLRQAVERTLVVAVNLEGLLEGADGPLPISCLKTRVAQRAPQGGCLRGFLKRCLQKQGSLRVVAAQPGQIGLLKLHKSRARVEALNFFEQALGPDKFSLLEGFGKLFKEARGGAEARPRLCGRLQPVDGLQQGFQIQRMRLCGFLIHLCGPGKTVGQAIKIQFPGGGFNPMYRGGHEQKWCWRKG
jgi:hypothetical protein